MAKYRFKTKPYKHQVAALKKLMELDGVGALLMEPRTGKTKVAIDFVSMAHQVGKCNRVLIICPSAVMDVWVQEIEVHCPVKYRVTVWDKKGRKKVDLPRFGQDVLDFVIINYDAFSTPGAITGRDDDGNVIRSKRRGGRYDMKKAILAWMPHTIILDESHRIKSPSARKSRIIHSLSSVAPYRLIMTGTAVTKQKRVYDLYSQWKFLNPKSPLIRAPGGGGMATVREFKERFGVWTTRNSYPQWLRTRNPKTLHRLLHQESFAVSREECFDLPANYPDQIIHVPLEESGPVYDQMAQEMVAMIHSGEITQASIKLVQNLRFSQITSGLAKVEPTEEHPNGTTRIIGAEKLRALEDLLVDWFDQDEKVVICARFKADILRIRRLCRKLKVEPQVLYGGQTREDRTAQIKAFRDQKGAGAFIMNPQAGSMGIDLRTASTMIWYSMIQSYVDYTQSRDRIALSGKANRFYFLLGEGTYDELQYATLGDDNALVQMIMASPEKLLRGFK